MPGARLRVEDVGPLETQKVLDFLNAAQTAEEIDRAVEIPGQRDIGVRIAQRILDRRAQLGQFTSLYQVAEIRYVGPMRFARLVDCLSKRPEPLPPAAAPSYLQLLREIQALREELEAVRLAAGAGHRVTLHPVQPQPFLGQPVTIVTSVSGGATGPAVDVPVTFAATWGKLRTMDAGTLQLGTTVTARTGVDGMVRVALLPPTSEDLWDLQQDALETMLGLLDSAASTPQQTEAGLVEMARQYQWEPNFAFRRAVDIYFRDFRPSLLDPVNYRDAMQAWSYLPTTVLAYVRGRQPDGRAGTSLLGAALLSLQFKDWLGPWLQTYLRSSELESEMQAALQRVKQQGGEPAEMADRVYDCVRGFMDGRRGLVGTYVGQKVVERVVGRFVVSGMDDLPMESRLALLPALRVVSSMIGTAGIGVLSAVVQARVDRQALDALSRQVDDVSTQLATKMDAPELGAAPNTMGRLLGLLAEHFSSLDTRFSELKAPFERIP